MSEECLNVLDYLRELIRDEPDFFCQTADEIADMLDFEKEDVITHLVFLEKKKLVGRSEYYRGQTKFYAMRQ